MPVMPQLCIETFRASIMIAGSFGRYSAQSARDHESARHGTGHSCIVASMIRRRAGGVVAELARSALLLEDAIPPNPLGGTYPPRLPWRDLSPQTPLTPPTLLGRDPPPNPPGPSAKPPWAIPQTPLGHPPNPSRPPWPRGSTRGPIGRTLLGPAAELSFAAACPSACSGVCCRRDGVLSGLCFKAMLQGERAVAQLARVPVSKTGGWGFESLLPCECGPAKPPCRRTYR